MSEKTNVRLDVRARLDTANPPTDRVPGTLTVAQDVATRWLGPRAGDKQFTNPHNVAAADKPGPATALISFDGTDDYVNGTFASNDQRDLGTQWTFDIVFRAHTSHPGASIEDIVLFQWQLVIATSLNAIQFSIRSDQAAPGKERQVDALIKTTDPAGTEATSTQFTSTAQMSVGTDPEDIHHCRVVRDRGTMTFYVDGTLVSTSTAIPEDEKHEGTAALGQFNLCDPSASSGDRFDGEIFYVRLRSGAHSEPTLGFVDYLFPRNPDVRLQIHGATRGGEVKDYSMWASHTGPSGIFGSPSTAANPTFYHPYMAPVQGARAFTDLENRSWNCVMAGGTLYVQRVT